MNTKNRKTLSAAVLAVLLAASPVMPAARISAASLPQTAPQAVTAATYAGSNTGNQNYIRWSRPVESYLVPCGDGTLMRLQYVSSSGETIAEYYNASRELQSARSIPQELPLFGGFYATDRYYFLLTGQENPSESRNVEVYRITKYDKDWNRLGSAGLSDCNTTIPFDAGSARMDASGNYLIIRTCHEMYRSEDGYNHQSNVTIQLDMEQMKITDSFTDVMNLSYGYVSHSFNQFIRVENDHIVTLDHGDAYPRSLVLLRYPGDISSGRFTPDYYSPCTGAHMFTFSGETGDNTTGASAGGFEISGTSYLAAGNSVDQNSAAAETRNIFIAAADKQTGRIAINWLTDYAEGAPSASTPHMVKINDDRYAVLWSVKAENTGGSASTVYYTTISGRGLPAEEIYKLDGNLSDCVPVVAGNKLVWYTWEDDSLDFYEIDLEDLSISDKKEIRNGEKEFTISFDADGGTVDGDTALTTVDQKLPALPEASRTGYIFDGWYTGVSSGTKITPSTTFSADTAVYAHWTAAPDTDLPRVNIKTAKSPAKGKLKLSWKPVSSADGYQIAVSTGSTFTSGSTFTTDVPAGKQTRTISRLEHGKTYYVKIRAYQKIHEETGYGNWSRIRKVKIK